MANTNDDRLQRIQQLQHTDRAAAEALLCEFVIETFPDLNLVSAELRPLAVSLNSFNGFLTLKGGRRLFFKSHVEPNSIVSEFYNSDLLAQAGYPILKPLYASTDYGKQFLIYDLIESPSVFDVVRGIETGERDDLGALTAAQHRADDDLRAIYQRTLKWQVPEAAQQAPVHQLFHHRLGTRYEEFYAKKWFGLPGSRLKWETICRRKWIINGIHYDTTINDALATAREQLEPTRSRWAVIGHGDAHNGNVFYTTNGLVYFDPAFAGRHHPLLDLAKPLFHNVFASWMYFPQEISAELEIDWQDDGTTITVQHNYRLSAVRQMLFLSKVQRVLQPLLEHVSLLNTQSARIVPELYLKWRSYLKSALLCCPLLTMNLTDRTRFTPKVALLGLTYVVMMGAESGQDRRSPFDQHLDAIVAHNWHSLDDLRF